jgi:hypothetical protein
VNFGYTTSNDHDEDSRNVLIDILDTNDAQGHDPFFMIMGFSQGAAYTTPFLSYLKLERQDLFDAHFSGGA